MVSWNFSLVNWRNQPQADTVFFPSTSGQLLKDDHLGFSASATIHAYWALALIPSETIMFSLICAIHYLPLKILDHNCLSLTNYIHNFPLNLIVKQNCVQDE